MYVSFDSNMLDIYVEHMGLPFVAVNLDGDPIGFIFLQPGGYPVEDLVQVLSVEEMHRIANR